MFHMARIAPPHNTTLQSKFHHSETGSARRGGLPGTDLRCPCLIFSPSATSGFSKERYYKYMYQARSDQEGTKPSQYWGGVKFDSRRRVWKLGGAEENFFDGLARARSGEMITRQPLVLVQLVSTKPVWAFCRPARRLLSQNSKPQACYSYQAIPAQSSDGSC